MDFDMKERVVRFRTSLVGGFDRNDVMRYIKTLSEERNALKRELSELKSKADDEPSGVESETLVPPVPAVSAQDEPKTEDAAVLLDRLERKYTEIGEQISRLRARVDAEL